MYFIYVHVIVEWMRITISISSSSSQDPELINVTSLADINGNELVVLPVVDRLAWGVQAVDNGHDAMIAVIRQVHPQRVIIADAIAEAYNVDSDDVC